MVIAEDAWSNVELHGQAEDQQDNAFDFYRGQAGEVDIDTSVKTIVGNDNLPELSQQPDIAIRQLYEYWVELGGYDRGKPRHSVRQIKEWLREDDLEIRSLETKLAGKTWLQRQDAEILLNLFFERWIYNADSSSYDAHQYGVEELTQDLISSWFSPERPALLLPERGKTRKSQLLPAGSGSESAPSTSALESTPKPSREVIIKLFGESDVLMTISREHSIIGPDPARSMKLFHELISQLYDTDKNDPSRRRALVWIVDIGLRDRYGSSRQAYLNVENLAAQFRSLALVGDEIRNDLWAWLSSRVVILVGSLNQSEIDWAYADRDSFANLEPVDLPWFMGDRLFLESPSMRWLQSMANMAGVHENYDMGRQTFTVHFAKDGWKSNQTYDFDPGNDLRFFFHKVQPNSNPAVQTKGNRRPAQCIELGPPGRRWSDAFRLAISAGFERLGWDEDVQLDIDPIQALAQLRKHHFGVFTLRNFLQLPNKLIDTNFDGLADVFN